MLELQPSLTSGITQEGGKEPAAFTKPRMLFISVREKKLENIFYRHVHKIVL